MYRRVALVVLRSAVAAGLALACSDPGVSPPDTTGPTGTLTIRVAGLLETASSGGTVWVLRTDIKGQPGMPFDVPPNGSTDLTLTAGTYAVTYVPPRAYNAYQPNSLSGVVVPASDTAVAAFGVYLAKGTLVIEVNVVAAPYPSTGGSASILRTDIGGQTPSIVHIPNQVTEGYFAAVDVLPGMYTVTYTPPNGYRVMEGSLNPLTVVVEAHNTTVVTFDVTPSEQSH